MKKVNFGCFLVNFLFLLIEKIEMYFIIKGFFERLVKYKVVIIFFDFKR